MVAAQFTGAGVCSTEFLCFCFWYCRACSPPPKLDWGVHREVSRSVQSWRPLQCPAGGEGPELSLMYTGFMMGTGLEVFDAEYEKINQINIKYTYTGICYVLLRTLTTF